MRTTTIAHAAEIIAVRLIVEDKHTKVIIMPAEHCLPGKYLRNTGKDEMITADAIAGWPMRPAVA
jgi:hypothetical protein